MPYTLSEIHGRRAGLTPTNRIGLLGRFFDVTMVASTNGTNSTKVTFQLVDHEGNSVAAVRTFLITLSDDATNGAGLTATTASGAVAAGASGADMGALTAKKALIVQTNASGVYVLTITDTLKTAFTVVANLWDHASLLTLATANYG